MPNDSWIKYVQEGARIPIDLKASAAPAFLIVPFLLHRS